MDKNILILAFSLVILTLTGCGEKYTQLCFVYNNGDDIKIVCQKEIDGYGDSRWVEKRSQYMKLEDLKHYTATYMHGIKPDSTMTYGKQIVGKYTSKDTTLDMRIYFKDGTNGLVKIR